MPRRGNALTVPVPVGTPGEQRQRLALLALSCDSARRHVCSPRRVMAAAAVIAATRIVLCASARRARARAGGSAAEIGSPTPAA